MQLQESKSQEEMEESSNGTMCREIEKPSVSTFHRTMTQEERQLMHPLELNDKLAFETIKTVRLDFLTEEAKAPIPRC